MTQELTGAPRRLPTLTGMRMIAAAMVFLSHTTLMNFFADEQVNDWSFRLFSRAGSAGVGFFFVLSGFVLAWSARDGEPKRVFWRRRAAKIMPSNLVVCAVVVVLLALTGQDLLLWPLLANVTLVQSWVPDMTVFNGVNPPTWSLSCEVFFYAAFPWLIAAVRRISGAWLWPIAGAVAAGVMVLPVLAAALPAEPVYAYADAAFPQFWFVYGLPLSRTLDFTLGILMARLVLEGRWIRLGLPSAALLTLAGYGVTLAVPLLFSVAATMVVPLALLVAAGAQADVAAQRSPLRGRTAGWLGEVSYAFYLIHIIVLYGASQLTGDGWGGMAATGVIAGAFLATLGLSALLYTGVERPMMRRFGTRRSARGLSPHTRTGTPVR